jgi:WD40 repeat protein
VALVDTWRDDPVAAVAAAVHAPVPGGTFRLADALAERTLTVDGEVYLMLDQIEEYFLYHRRDDGGPLAGELEEILTRPDLRVHVLLGVRDDALAELDAFKARLPGLFGNVLRLDHLDRDGARSAIAGPLEEYARLGGASVTAEPALVEAVIEQVAAGRIEQGLTGRGGVETDGSVERVEAPYLQLVMERLWHVERARGSTVLSRATLDELGGAAQVVEQHLELALAGLAVTERDVASRLFNHLVTPSGTKIAHGVGDLARYVGSPDDGLEHILRNLAAQRIVRPLPGSNGGGARYEIFHDVLADAVLGWRARHETERALEVERAEAWRRHRRLALVAGVALAALAVTAGIAVYALAQRERADNRARTAEGRELTVSSISRLNEDPELSVLLALEAAEREATPDVEDALRAALLSARARRTVSHGTPLLAATLRGGRIVVSEVGGRVTAVGFSRDGRLLARATGRTVEVHASDGGRITRFRLPAQAVRVAMTPSAVAAAGADGTLVVVAVPSGAPLLRTALPSRPTALALSDDGRQVVAASGKIARVFETATGRKVGTLEVRSTVLATAFSPDRALVATGSADGGVRLWDLAHERLVNVFLGHNNLVRALAFTPDGERLVSAGADRTGRIVRVEDGHVYGVLAGHTDEIKSVVVSRDGTEAVTASADGTARVWDIRGDPDLDVVATLPGKTPALVGADSTAIVVRSGTRDVRIDARSGRVVGSSPSTASPTRVGGWRVMRDGAIVRLERAGRAVTLVGHTDDVTSVRLSPDGMRIITGGADHDVRVWDAATGNLLRVLKAHVGRVADARYSRDGRWIVTAGPGVGVWNARTWQLLFYLRGHEGPVTGAAFAPDSRTIVTTGTDGTVRTYRCRVCGGLAELMVLAQRRLDAAGRTLTAEERQEFRLDG